MKQLTEALLAHFQGNLTSIATCWKVTRTDKTVLGFTDHDVNKVIDGTLFVASSGYFRTAIANSATVSVDNLEIRGFLDNELISEVDLRNGAYDFAEVEIFAINWMDLSQGICRLRYGLFGEVTIRPSGMFVVELRGLMQLFSQTVGETISPDCRADLGDHRCKVELLPQIRRSAGTYNKDDRMIVPLDSGLTSISLPIKNSNFDWYANANYYLWRGLNGVVTNYPHLPYDEEHGLYYVKPTSATGSMRRRLGINPETGTSEFSFGFSAGAYDDGWQIGGTVEFLQIAGIGGIWDETNITVLDSYDVPWTSLGSGGGWESAFEDFKEYVPEEASDIRIIIKWRNSNLEVVPDTLKIGNPSFTLNDVVFDDEYFKFEIPAVQQSGYNVPGWGGSFKYSNPGTLMLMPETGSAYMQDGLNWIYAATQTLLLSDAGADLFEVDAGKYKFKSRTTVGSPEWGYTGYVGFFFYNAADQVIGTIESGFKDLIPASQFIDFDLEGEVPPLTRSVRIELYGGRSALRDDGSQPPTAFGSIRAEFLHTETDPLNLMLYGGVEYKALNGGTILPDIPVFTHTIGEIIDDGQVQWECVYPRYTFLGTITDVVDNFQFTVSGMLAPDDWFTWGVLRFLDGKNRSRGVEVLTYNGTTGTFRLMLPALHAPAVGDHVAAHVGCDKTRGAGGCLRFGNILNYRGEPEVPGTDQYFKVGGTGASGAHSTSEAPDYNF